MGTFKEFNPYSCGTFILMFREPDYAVSACLTKGHFQDYLKLLGRKKLKLMQIAGVHICSGNISKAPSLKILNGYEFSMNEKTFSGPKEEGEMNVETGLYRKNEDSKITAELEIGFANWTKKLFKSRDSGVRTSQAPIEARESGSSDAGKAASPTGKGSSTETISPSELQKGLASGASFLILDVREKNELSGKLGHLENSVNIPVGSLENRVFELENERDREIIVVCRSGMRAVRAAEILAREGFGKVKVLRGGMIAWRDLQA